MRRRLFNVSQARTQATPVPRRVQAAQSWPPPVAVQASGTVALRRGAKEKRRRPRQTRSGIRPPLRRRLTRPGGLVEQMLYIMPAGVHSPSLPGRAIAMSAGSALMCVPPMDVLWLKP